MSGYWKCMFRGDADEDQEMKNKIFDLVLNMNNTSKQPMQL